MSMVTAPTQANQDNKSAPLPAHTAVYEVLRRGSKIGEVHITLSQDEQGIWHFDTETVATSRLARMLRLSAEESAHFVWEGDRIVMLTYHQVARGPVRNRFWQHQLDWAEGISNTHTYDGDYRIELEPNIVDPLTLRLQLAAFLADPDKRGQDFDLRVLERDEIEDQQLLFRGRETVNVPAGCFETVKMHRFRREGSSRNYYSWVAEAFHWLPVRIRLSEEDGEDFETQLVETDVELGNGEC
jgi:hypothetical protein